jgi:hypothetical protein
MQPDLFAASAEFAPPPSYRRGTAAGAARSSDTSVAAAASLQSSLPARQLAVLNVIEHPAGATLSEIMSALDLPAQSVSGRITELRLSGQVVDSGRTRPSPTSGRAQTVWVTP